MKNGTKEKACRLGKNKASHGGRREANQQQPQIVRPGYQIWRDKKKVNKNAKAACMEASRNSINAGHPKRVTSQEGQGGTKKIRLEKILKKRAEQEK